MRLLKKAVLAASLAALLSGAMVMAATAAPASTSAVQAMAAPSARVAAVAAGWEHSIYYDIERDCLVSKAIRASAGYNVLPTSGCYHDQYGYYYLYEA